MSTALFDPLRTMATITDEVIVAFSGGKDSIVTLDLCQRFFKRVEPFFMWIVPNLSFQENHIQSYERKYKVKILRLPHFEVSDFMRYGTFRDPDYNVPIVSVTDIYEYLREKTGIHWIAAGERVADSIVRRAMIKHSGSIDKKRGRFYPIAYWSKADIMYYIRFKKLHIDNLQRKLGFSFRSLHGYELSIVKEMFPEDYNRILRFYPLAEAGIKNYELREKRKHK